MIGHYVSNRLATMKISQQSMVEAVRFRRNSPDGGPLRDKVARDYHHVWEGLRCWGLNTKIAISANKLEATAQFKSRD